MIPLVRVDNRLLHGQVLEAWIPRLGARTVVVADDAAAGNPIARAAMTLCLPAGVEARISAIAAVDFPALAAAAAPVLVLVREVASVLEATGLGLTPAMAPVVNLGNVHFAAGRRALTPSVYLGELELALLRRLADAGFRIEARALPTEPPIGLTELERRYLAAHPG